MDTSRTRLRQNLRTLTGRATRQRRQSVEERERKMGLRFVMRVRGQVVSADRVSEAIAQAHGLDVLVRPLANPQVPGAEAVSRFAITIPGIARADIPQHVFDLARQLQQTEGLAIDLVEPDIPIFGRTGDHPGADETMLRSLSVCGEDHDETLAKDWHIATVRARDAWNIMPPAGGARFGEGIRIGHPDTGWVDHLELDTAALDIPRSYDVLDDDPDARDPLISNAPIPSPGHGLGTGSVIVSGHSTGVLKGVAPKAKLVPIRTTDSVALFFSSDLTDAVERAVQQDCHVLSISLGGTWLHHLEEAILDAVDRNLIVCAASGNCIWFVPSPAAYDVCIAVAATWHDDTPWDGSSEGSVVDIASPGVNIWVARRKRGSADRTQVDQSTGASPATATVAGAAALWLAFHGRDALLARYAGSDVRLQHVFAALLKRTARKPGGWPTGQYGAGILDIHALLTAPLPSEAEVRGLVAVREPFAFASPVMSLAAMTSLTPEEVEQRLGALLGSEVARSLGGDPEQHPIVGRDADQHAHEVMSILAEHQAAFDEFVYSQFDRDAIDGRDGASASTEQRRASMRTLTQFASQGLRDAMESEPGIG